MEAPSHSPIHAPSVRVALTEASQLPCLCRATRWQAAFYLSVNGAASHSALDPLSIRQIEGSALFRGTPSAKGGEAWSFGCTVLTCCWPGCGAAFRLALDL